jgi:hypothetical protein
MEDTLSDTIFDAIADARHTLRVSPTKTADGAGATYFVSFMLNIDSKTHEILRAVAVRKERSVPKLLRRYALECFKQCIADEETDEAELKEAA